MQNWIVTLPKTVEWSDYEQELLTVANGEADMFFRVPKHFKSAEPGDRCYITHKGIVRGYMIIKGIERHELSFTCMFTGKQWPPGTYVKRSGPFYITPPVEVPGFQGIRRYEVADDE